MFIDEMTLTIENTDKTYHKRNKARKKHSPVKVFQ